MALARGLFDRLEEHAQAVFEFFAGSHRGVAQRERSCRYFNARIEKPRSL